MGYSRGWSRDRLAHIETSNTDAGDAFGIAVSLSSDGQTLVVDASGEDGNGTNIDSQNNSADNSVIDSGAAYLY